MRKSTKASEMQMTKEKVTKLVVGASAVPHAEVLEEAKPILKEKGIDLRN